MFLLSQLPRSVMHAISLQLVQKSSTDACSYLKFKEMLIVLCKIYTDRRHKAAACIRCTAACRTLLRSPDTLMLLAFGAMH